MDPEPGTSTLQDLRCNGGSSRGTGTGITSTDPARGTRTWNPDLGPDAERSDFIAERNRRTLRHSRLSRRERFAASPVDAQNKVPIRNCRVFVRATVFVTAATRRRPGAQKRVRCATNTHASQQIVRGPFHLPAPAAALPHVLGPYTSTRRHRTKCKSSRRRGHASCTHACLPLSHVGVARHLSTRRSSGCA